MSTTALQEAISEVDQQVAAWLEATAVQIDSQKNLYWRAQITNLEWQRTLDHALFEMRQVASILRARPINTKGGL